jgi:hypothetical protein
MGTITKEEAQNVITFTLRITKKQIRLMKIILTISSVAGVVLFFLKHF